MRTFDTDSPEERQDARLMTEGVREYVDRMNRMTPEQIATAMQKCPIQGHQALPPGEGAAMSDILVRLKQAQCCDPVIDSLIGAAIEQIAALTAERDVFKLEMKRAHCAFEVAEVECDRLREALEKLTAERDSLRAEKAVAAIPCREHSDAAWRRICQALTVKRDAQKERADSNWNSLERIKAKYSDCANELRAATTAERDDLKSSYDTVLMDNNAMTALLGQVSEENDKLTAERDRLSAEVGGAKLAMRNAQQGCERAEAEADSLQLDLDKALGRLEAGNVRLKASRAERDRLREALKTVEWCHGGGKCPKCSRYREHGHAPDCIVGLALQVRNG